jgi:hypothetical protein
VLPNTERSGNPAGGISLARVPLSVIDGQCLGGKALIPSLGKGRG